MSSGAGSNSNCVALSSFAQLQDSSVNAGQIYASRCADSMPITLLLLLQTGLQEKATFLQAFGKKGVYSSFIALPAIAELLLLATVLLVLWQYAAPAASGSRRQQVEYSPVEVDVHA